MPKPSHTCQVKPTSQGGAGKPTLSGTSTHVRASVSCPACPQRPRGGEPGAPPRRAAVPAGPQPARAAVLPRRPQPPATPALAPGGGTPAIQRLGLASQPRGTPCAQRAGRNKADFQFHVTGQQIYYFFVRSRTAPGTKADLHGCARAAVNNGTVGEGLIATYGAALRGQGCFLGSQECSFVFGGFMRMCAVTSFHREIHWQLKPGVPKWVPRLRLLFFSPSIPTFFV